MMIESAAGVAAAVAQTYHRENTSLELLRPIAISGPGAPLVGVLGGRWLGQARARGYTGPAKPGGYAAAAARLYPCLAGGLWYAETQGG